MYLIEQVTEMTPSIQNLNSKLSKPARRPHPVGIRRGSSPSQSPPRVRIAGAGSSYRGGYRLNV
jgi:hypothetical protein